MIVQPESTISATLDVANIPHNANIVVSHEQLSEFKYKNFRKRPRNATKESEIIESIKKDGIRDQLKVWIEEGTNILQVLGGYGRWEKAATLNIPLPCKVFRISEADAMRIHLQDNTQREDLTFVEEVEAAKTIYTLHGSDFETTRVELGWSKTKLRERLEIAKCSEKVKRYINEQKLELGHAILLAPYKVEVQEEKADFIVNNNVTVKALREIMGKVQINLSEAKFDLKECSSCEFNTKDQLNLFGSLGGEERCRKASCFKKKTQTWLESIKSEAEERYGTVIFLSQTDTKQTKLVNVQIMGKEQYHDGCSNCTSNVAIMCDEVGKEGLISENQCIDSICYKKLTSPTLPESESESDLSENKNISTAAGTKSPAAKNPKITEFKPTEKLREKNRKQLRDASGQFFKSDANMYSVIQTANMVQNSGYSPTGVKGHGFRAIVNYCLTLERSELQKLSTTAYHHMIEKTVSVASTEMIDVMIDALRNAGDKGDIKAREQWVMDELTLKMYTTKALLSICEKSGIKLKLEQSGTWKTVSKMKQGDLIKKMVETQPDSPIFAPNDYLMNIK